jgi:hypothetical protein
MFFVRNKETLLFVRLRDVDDFRVFSRTDLAALLFCVGFPVRLARPTHGYVDGKGQICKTTFPRDCH